MIPRELAQLANVCGVLTSYRDVRKKRRQASVETLLAVLAALGVDVASLEDVPRALETRQQARLRRGIEPVIVAWDGEAARFDFTLPVADAHGKGACMVQIEGENEPRQHRFDVDQIPGATTPCGDYVTLRPRLPRGLGDGYHRLTIESAGQSFESFIIAAPRHAYTAAEASGNEWGCFLPLYALKNQRNWGAGDYTDLRDLAAWTAGLGGRVVGTLPVLAAFLDEPCEPSPYAPASRLAWNEFYVDVAAIPELAACPKAAERMQSAAFVEDLSRFREAEHVRYRGIMALKRQILEFLAEAFFERRPQPRYAQFQEFLQQHVYQEDYAAFRAVQERRQAPWHQWPPPLREGRLSEGDFERRQQQYHAYAQWIATTQLESLADASGGGLYLDLPLGVRADGYDVWKWRDAYACDASAGSPPDAMWTKGQNWCFPPLHPERIRAQGYRHVRDYLRHHLRLARLLRIDHVMQLHRLYWIPHGLRADQGSYVRYRPEEFYAILNLESHRCQTTLIGENLGTVPPEINQAMDRHQMKRMYVVQYEIAARDAHSAPPAVPPGSLASLNTHDMPSYAAWWRGADLALRQELDLIDEKQAARELSEREALKQDLVAWLRSAGWLAASDAGEEQVQLGILEFLAASEAGVVLVNLEDLWLETRPQNVPGTEAERPNWRRKAEPAFEQFTADPLVLRPLQEIDKLRKKASGEKP